MWLVFVTWGEIARRRRAWLTPDTVVEAADHCRQLLIPGSEEWLAIVSGALAELTLPYNWEQSGDLTPQEAAEIATSMLLGYYTGSCAQGAEGGVPTPFWDEDTDVDDEYPADAQPWYGTVTDPEAAQEDIELDFVENFAIWTLTGFLAIATWEIGAAPAILFSTIAPKFVLAMRRGNFGEVIRILVDGEEAVRVDTGGAAEGTVIRVPVVANPDLSTHNIAIVQVS
jgi:hypothetical protein